MGLFNFFNKKKINGHDIPENLFIEKENHSPEEAPEKNEIVQSENGIAALYQFLEKNYEGKGYDDALINPDNNHLHQNVELLKNDLERAIKRVKTFYEDFIAEINFHISSRSRSGMIDTVEELNMKKDIAESHIAKVLEIESDTHKNQGACQGILMSYTRGFKNGLAAISHHNILKRKF